MNSYNSLIAFSLLIIASCNDSQIKQYDDTPVSGEITICVDETFKPIIDSEVFTFQSLYNRVKINPRYVSEGKAFQDLLRDSCRLIIASRDLNDNEKKYFSEIPIVPKVTHIATDAIAFIIHPENKDTNFTYEELIAVFAGKTPTWKSGGNSPGSDPIRIVFDNSNSSTARFIKEILTKNDILPANCFAVNGNEEVIDYCSQHKNALGVIGVNWISDGDDPASKTFKNKIKVLGIYPPGSDPGIDRSYKPYQAYIAQKLYPFTREIYIISREARSGLGSGFSAFVGGDKGQRIILKSGLMPATKPVRIVGFRDNN